jgi:succinoglycan biosynthesis transport protein ExoP
MNSSEGLVRQRGQGKEIKQYFQTVWKWWWLIVLCTLCAGIASFVVSSMMPPVYQARLMLMSNQSTNTGIVNYSSLLGGQQVIETYRELLKTRSVLQPVIAGLDLPYSLRELTEHIDVSIIPDTQLLDLRVEDTDAQRASDIANEIALTFLLQRSTEQQLQEIQNYEQTIVEQMGALEQAIDETEAEMEQLRVSPGLLMQDEWAVLQANQSQQRVAYANLLAGYVSIRSIESQLLDVVIVEPARPPTEPIRPRRVLNTAFAALSGCIIACVAAFLLEYLNYTLQDADEVREALSLPTLGAIPRVKSWQEDGRVRVQAEEWPAGEAFRILRTNIQFSSVDRVVRTLLVTSTVPQEGKTAIVANLGAVIAQGGRKVLLVDADLRRPRLHRALEVPNRVGLSSLMLGGEDLQECIAETGIANLHVLPSGPLPPNPSELLGSQRMQDLLHELAQQADVMLIDSPPVLPVADAAVLARRVDGVLLVLEAGRTRQEAARRAVENLRQVGANLIGVVLNGVTTRRGGYYYYEYNGDGSGRRERRSRRWPKPLAAVQRLLTRRPKVD